MQKTLIALLAMPVLTFNAYAQNDDDDASTPGPERCPRIQASTVFVPDKASSRQKGSAELLSETHRTAQDQGWDFDDLEIYIEDGDLQGFFVTYTRPHPCNRSS